VELLPVTLSVFVSMYSAQSDDVEVVLVVSFFDSAYFHVPSSKSITFFPFSVVAF